jgi:hypothetical protein
VDNDGDALITGALYYNSTTDVMRVYDGSAWIDSGSGLTFAEISATPTTLAGYGITDAVASSSVSVYGASLIDDADAATARTTLGLGTAATTASTDYATAAQGTTADAALAASAVSSFGLTLVDDADAATARTTLGLGTAATTAASAYATAAQGTTADSALQSDSTLNADNMTTGTLSGGTY